MPFPQFNVLMANRRPTQGQFHYYERQLYDSTIKIQLFININYDFIICIIEFILATENVTSGHFRSKFDLPHLHSHWESLSAEFRKGAPPPRSCTNFLTPWLILFDDYQIPGVTTFFAYRSTRFFLQLKKQVKYYQKQWYLGNSDHTKFFLSKNMFESWWYIIIYSDSNPCLPTTQESNTHILDIISR